MGMLSLVFYFLSIMVSLYHLGINEAGYIHHNIRTCTRNRCSLFATFSLMCCCRESRKEGTFCLPGCSIACSSLIDTCHSFCVIMSNYHFLAI